MAEDYDRAIMENLYCQLRITAIGDVPSSRANHDEDCIEWIFVLRQK